MKKGFMFMTLVIMAGAVFLFSQAYAADVQSPGQVEGGYGNTGNYGHNWSVKDKKAKDIQSGRYNTGDYGPKWSKLNEKKNPTVVESGNYDTGDYGPPWSKLNKEEQGTDRPYQQGFRQGYAEGYRHGMEYYRGYHGTPESSHQGQMKQENMEQQK